MKGRATIVMAILVACTVIATVAARDPAPPMGALTELPKGSVYILSDGGSETTLENIELRTIEGSKFVVGREAKDGPTPNQFGDARTWVRLSSIKMMVEVPK
jgi:hypothetical protein